MPVRSDQILLLATLWLVVQPAASAEPRWPTPEQVEQARHARPVPAVPLVTPPPVPSIEPKRPAVDIESLVHRHALKSDATQNAQRQQPLRVFVTLDMPAASLRALSSQASRAGATLVLRGLKNQSMKATLTAVQALVGDDSTAWQIDPQAFVLYQVKHAPTFMLSASPAPEGMADCADNCRLPEKFVSVSGDVTLDYALEAMQRQVPSSRLQIAPYLARLRRQQ